MVQWEYKLGPLTVNFRVLLEPKGFLRIVLLFIALLAFSITAGFNSGSVTSTPNTLTCLGSNINSTTATNLTTNMTFSYPYAADNFALPIPSEVSNMTLCTNATSAKFGSLVLSTSAQFFVAMGVLTMLYVIGALLIYLMFITPELFLAKWLVIGDFFMTIVFGVLYLISCIAWSAGAADLNSFISSRLQGFGEQCLGCNATAAADGVNVESFAQPAISLLFGWLAAFIWLASSWFVYKDTEWHKDQTGPLAALYNIGDKNTATDAEQNKE